MFFFTLSKGWLRGLGNVAVKQGHVILCLWCGDAQQMFHHRHMKTVVHLSVTWKTLSTAEAGMQLSKWKGGKTHSTCMRKMAARTRCQPTSGNPPQLHTSNTHKIIIVSEQWTPKHSLSYTYLYIPPFPSLIQSKHIHLLCLIQHGFFFSFLFSVLQHVSVHVCVCVCVCVCEQFQECCGTRRFSTLRLGMELWR